MTNSKLEVDKFGKRWRNSKNQLHRKNAPANITINGDIFWFLNGQSHRIDGPSDCWHSGIKSWYLENNCIREFVYD